MAVRRKNSHIEQIKFDLASLDENIALLMRNLDKRFEDVNHRLHSIKGSTFERLEDIEGKLRLLELNVRAVRRAQYNDKEGWQ